MSPWVRRGSLVIADFLVLVAAGKLTFLLHGTGRLTPSDLYLFAGAVIFVMVFLAFGLYSRLWRYASVRDMLAVLLACAVAGSALLFVNGVPVEARLFYLLLVTAGLGGIRMGRRAYREVVGRGSATLGRRVLVAGAGDAGVELVRELTRHQELGLKPVGFVDDDQTKRRQVAHGVPVLGACRDVVPVAERLGATEVAIAMPSAPGPTIRAIWAEAAAAGLRVRIMPSSLQRGRGQGLARQLREVQLEDLLGRPEVGLDQRLVSSTLTGRVVLVTGAGGSIGSELCRQVAQLDPAMLVLVGHGENSLYQLQAELREAYPAAQLRAVVGDVRDEERLRVIFRRFQPHVVFHAAAHKHVTLMEQNPTEAVQNNVLGTYNLAQAAAAHGAERFVLISTDKAVNATSVMGASKRAAEWVVQQLARQGNTLFVTVRFGNVLGSRGSVVPLFQRQIARGGPVTITHPEATRYFMTIPEAARLVLQAAAMGESADVFVLDMGQPVRILDLARDLIRLAGLTPGEEIPVLVTGLSPGEKLHEELFTEEERVSATRHERIYKANPRREPPISLERAINQFRVLCGAEQLSSQAILAVLGETERGGEAHEPGRSAQEAY